MSNPMTITQRDALEWVRSKWPTRTDPIWRAAKLGEEAGEVLGAVIKMDEGRKSLDDLRMETAQVVICAMALAQSAGFDLAEAIEAEWQRVGCNGHFSRWVACPIHGSCTCPTEVAAPFNYRCPLHGTAAKATA